MIWYNKVRMIVPAQLFIFCVDIYHNYMLKKIMDRYGNVIFFCVDAYKNSKLMHILYSGRHGRVLMVGGFITTYAISAYHH
jgi:hypothetical protein